MFSVDIGIHYAGFCYDGPREGEWHDSETSMLYLHSQDPLWFHKRLSDHEPPVTALHQIYYRWSDPLKKWVCLNMK
jgi:hypothetical protein